MRLIMVDASIAGLLIVLLISRWVGLLKFPRSAYILASVVGFAAWGQWFLSRYSVIVRSPTIEASVLEVALFLQPLLPILAGLTGWVGVQSRWRWLFLASGVGLQMFPFVAFAFVWLTGKR